MKKGISLYELLIVMAIIVIVAAITVPMVNYYLPSLRLSSSARDIVTKLRQAQEEAVTTQIRHGVKFNTTSPTSIDFFKFVDGIPPTPPTITVLENIQLPNNITLTLDSLIRNNPNNTNSIIFSADGGPDVNGNIIVGLTDYSSKIIIVSPAGVIKLFDINSTPTPTPTPTPTQTPTLTPTPTPTPTPTQTQTPTIGPE